MENRGGYGYGIWLLLTPNNYVPFKMFHKFHITLISNIYCKRKAQNLFSRILKDNLNLPKEIFSKDLETNSYISYDSYSAIGWDVNIYNWENISKKIKDMCSYGNIPEVPHISLQYFRTPDFTFSDHYFKDLHFSVNLALVDMNDSIPSNWCVIH